MKKLTRKIQSRLGWEDAAGHSSHPKKFASSYLCHFIIVLVSDKNVLRHTVNCCCTRNGENRTSGLMNMQYWQFCSIMWLKLRY